MKRYIFFISLSVCFVLPVKIPFVQAYLYCDDLQDLKKNAIEINPMSDGIYIGLERVLVDTSGALLVLDAKNTTQNGKSFGQAGLTYRLGINDKKLFSSRIQTAWQEGQNNIAVKAAYDNPFFGLAVTGVKSLTDPEIISTQDVQSVQLSSNSEDTFTERSGGYDVYERATTTTNRVDVNETHLATPDGILVDIHMNVLRRLNFELGGSYWESESWNDMGVHATLSFALSQDDLIGGHVAHINDQTEGGLYYKKRFSSFGDIFRKGAPLPEGEDVPLIRKMAALPFSTPPIKILTTSEYVKKTQEIRTSTTTEDVKVKVITNNPPSITLFDAVSPVGAGGFLNVTGFSASDSDGQVVSWRITSSVDGVIATGSWPFSAPTLYAGLTAGSQTITATVTDDDGDSVSTARTITIN